MGVKPQKIEWRTFSVSFNTNRVDMLWTKTKIGRDKYSNDAQHTYPYSTYVETDRTGQKTAMIAKVTAWTADRRGLHIAPSSLPAGHANINTPPMKT